MTWITFLNRPSDYKEEERADGENREGNQEAVGEVRERWRWFSQGQYSKADGEIMPLYPVVRVGIILWNFCFRYLYTYGS